MKPLSFFKSLFLGLSLAASTNAIAPIEAMAFSEQEVNQQQFIAVAIPYNYQQYRLEIIEQLPGGQQCWQESTTNPVTVDLLLNNFDHTGSCRRISNTNGYTLRINGQDDRVARIDKIVSRNGELQLVAFHKDPSQPDLVIGRTAGITTNQPLKIFLNPEWRITKRVHQGQVLNHVYLSGNSANAQYLPAFPNASSTSSYPGNYPQNVPVASPSSPHPSTAVNSNPLVDTFNQLYGTFVNPLLNSVIVNDQSPNYNQQ